MAEPEQPVPSTSASEPARLRVDFTWRKFKSIITDTSNDKPFLIVKYTASKPQLEFESAQDDTVIGTGTIHSFSINPDSVIRGRRVQIKAMKRFKTRYTFLSKAYSKDPNKSAVMTFEASSDFKNWDFVCLNEQMEAVAKFSTNIWAMKNVGNFEFVGGLANDTAAREEIAIVGLTLMYCRAARTTSLSLLFGAVFARPGPIEDGKKD